MLRFILVLVAIHACRAFKSRAYMSSRRLALHLSKSTADRDNTDLERALAQAKENRDSNQSPGAGVEDAFEAAEAAYADLILTSIDQRELEEELGDEDLAALSKGGTMWEDGAKEIRNDKKAGFMGDLFNALSALAGGAHIVKDENGET